VTGQSKKDVVVGLGNILLSDEGIGVHIVRRLAEVKERYPQVDFIDAGSAGMSLLHLIANRKKAIIIDCAKMGEEPGTIRRFTSNEVQSIKQLSHYSLHETDILQVINLSKQLGERPEKIVFFGVEPESLDLGQNLSKTLAGKIDSYITEICKELS
jgi:hydrogenase maturation protease